MIDQAKMNISFLVIIIVASIATFISLEDTISNKKYNSPSVPVLNLPIEVKSFSPSQSTTSPPVKVQVLLGEPTTVEVKPLRAFKQKKMPGLNLRAIMINGNERLANINGKMMRVGAYIHGRTILSIKKNTVLLTGPKGKERLKVQD